MENPLPAQLKKNNNLENNRKYTACKVQKGKCTPWEKVEKNTHKILRKGTPRKRKNGKMLPANLQKKHSL